MKFNCKIAFVAVLWITDSVVLARHNGGSGSSTPFLECPPGPGLFQCEVSSCGAINSPQAVGSLCYQINLCNDHHHDPTQCDGCCESIDLCQDFGGYACDYDCGFDADLDFYKCLPKQPISCCQNDPDCGNCYAIETTMQECQDFLGDDVYQSSFRDVASGLCLPFAAVLPPVTDVSPPLPPRPSGGAMDDPHFLTWSGTWYDYMGECDLHLVYAPNFAALGSSFLSLTIDIRTTMRYFYSYIASAVVKIGSDTFEVASFGDYNLNGVANAELPAAISGFPINHTRVSKHIHLFEIQIDGEEVIKLKTFKDMVSVMVEGADEKRFHGSTGMMGEYGTGRMLGRDRVTIVEDPNKFAAEWQVQSSEPMLFQSVREPQHPQQCLLPQQQAKKPERRLGSLEASKKACAHWSKETIEGCIHDVMATGDLELAQSGPF